MVPRPPHNMQQSSLGSSSSSSSSTASSGYSSHDSNSRRGGVQRSRPRVVLGRLTRDDLRQEEADNELIVMRIQRSENFPTGTVMTLRCPPEIHLETARRIISEAAPRFRLPDPSTYAEMAHEARQLAIREEWRSIFKFYLRTIPLEQLGLFTGSSSNSLDVPSAGNLNPPSSMPLPSSTSSLPSAPSSTSCLVWSSAPTETTTNNEDQPSSSTMPTEMDYVESNVPSNSAGELEQASQPVLNQPPTAPVVTVREAAFLSTHRTNNVQAPANFTIPTDVYSGSLLFVKRFRFESQSPRPFRTRLESGLVVGDFEITDHARAFKIATREAYDYTVLTLDEFELYVAIVKRTSEAEKYYSDDDLEELKSMLLDPEADCVKTISGEYCYFTKISCGSLHMFAIEQPQHIREECQRFFNTLVRFVAFCHSLGIVLVDVSLRRFIFDDRDRSRLRLRCFTDVVVLETPTACDKIDVKFGCPAYVAPEVLSGEPHGGMKADLWSLGVILFVLVTGRFPFSDVTARGLLSKVRRAKVEIPTAGNLTPQAELLKNLPWINGCARQVSSARPRPLPRSMKIEEDDLNLHYDMDTPLPYPNNFLDLSLSGRAPSLFKQKENFTPCEACKASVPIYFSDHEIHHVDSFGG